jgi:membrane-bound lytic murein transglycosylase A
MPVGCGASRFPQTSAIVLATLWGLSAARCADAVLTIPGSRLEPLAWSALTGWTADDHAAAFDTFLASCDSKAMRSRQPRAEHVTDAPLRRICAAARALGPARGKEARQFFETYFKPVRIAKLADTDGFLTGYYEPVVEGSRQPTREFMVPVYRQPADLIPGVRQAGLGFANKGGAWRKVGNRRVPYYERAEIEDGALDGKGLEICWLKDPVDAFFMQIQGSARVRLEDGAILRLNYAAHNGYPYTPVGKLLVDSGAVPKEEMSMDRIRQWMEAHPDEGKKLRRQNRSFVFFRVADLAAHEEAIGAQGIPLTSGRSIAVDRRLHAYGTPFWIDARLPLTGESATDPFRRLMIAQDTGSAIVGPARADIYFGAGEAAGRVAGRIKHPAAFVMLVPRSLALTAVKQPVPLPRAKPKR